MDPQVAFADALARARQVAAKLSEKRAFEDDDDDDFPDSKKMASNETINAQLRAQIAAQAAANAAAQINAKLGLAGTAMQANPAAMAGMGGIGFSTTEIVDVPDKMVGLVIGKGGENISTIQTASGVKVQFAPDSGGLPNRPCTLTGTRDGIQKAKQMIQEILSRGQALPPSETFSKVGMSMGGGGAVTVEMMIPGPRAGLVIGKSGEMIKQIQERCGVKMVLIQDTNRPTDNDKPLRITGDTDKCQRAKEMVLDLLAQKEVESGSFAGNGMGGGGGGGEYGGRQNFEMPVPRPLVGVVIGRNGEVIKRISSETGTKVQFKHDDGTGPERICSIAGPPDGIQKAAQMVRELVQSAGRQDGARANGGGSFGGGANGGHGGAPDSTYNIPAEKCGLVIGKGGETIREINSRSGARVELSRNEDPSVPFRVFNIRGNPGQVQEAVRLICEKAGLPPPGPNPYGGPQYGGPPYGGPQYGQPGMGGPMPGYPNPAWGGPSPYPQQPQAPWGAPAAPSDPSKAQPGQDPMAAAWAAYYQSMYGQQQPGMPQQQPQSQQQQQNPQQPAAQQPGQQQQQAGGGAQQGVSYPAPTVNPQTGQMDYSAAWAEYYRQQGLYQQAQAITQQQPGGGQSH